MSNRRHAVGRALFPLIIWLAITGCAVLAPKKEIILLPDDFPKELARLETAATDHGSPGAVRADAHLGLARLYADHRNPNINYAKALTELDTYISLVPDKPKNDEVLSWIAVLKKLRETDMEKERITQAMAVLKTELEETKKAAEQLDQANQETKRQLDQVTQDTKKMMEQMEKKNQEMRDVIKQLESLDLQLEQRRRRIR